MIIAIDGPAGSGKSTIARMVAEGLGFTYVNSGNIYRAMTLRVLRAGLDAGDARAVLDCSRSASIEYRSGRLFLDGEDAEAELHSQAVDSLVAQLSAIPELRDIVNAHVRRVAGRTDAVAAGGRGTRESRVRCTRSAARDVPATSKMRSAPRIR